MRIYQISNNDVTLLVTDDIEAAKIKLEGEVIGTDRFGYPCYDVWEDGVRIESYAYFHDCWADGDFITPKVDLRTDLLREAQSGSLEKFYAFCLAVGSDIREDIYYFKGSTRDDLQRISSSKNMPEFIKIREDYEEMLQKAREERGLRADGYTLQDRLRAYAKAEEGSHSLCFIDPEINDRKIV